MCAHKSFSRRRFLGQSIAACVPAGVVLDRARTLLAAATGTAARPSATLIDTHTHFYDPTRSQGVPWPPKEDKLLYRTVRPKDYLALPTPRPVAGTVVVEASPWVEDNQWILELAAREPFIVGFVGNLPVGSAEFPTLLERFAANRLFRGIRVGRDALKTGLTQARFLADLELLVQTDLSLDVVHGQDLWELAAALAGKIPRLRIVVDHLAGVRVDGQPPAETWKQAMNAAAQHPNVHAKVSGLVEGTAQTDGKAPRDAALYRPVLDAVFEAFGEDRLIYGSNWPVSERFAPLEVVQQIVHDYFGSRGRAVEEKVFWRNAQAVYKWIKRK